MFGKPRVREIIREVARQSNASARRAVDAIDAALTQFLGDAKVKDDVTFVAVRVTDAAADRSPA
jgi:serine phosphatase RsbU (regulator of sigma subunit)